MDHARCATLGDPRARSLAIEIAESSTVELPSLIGTLYVLFGERSSAVFEAKARAALAMVDEAGSGDEIAWMARVLLALPPDDARDSAIALEQTLSELERADPGFVEDWYEASDDPAAPVLLVLAHVGELAQASAMLDRIVERASDPTERPRWVTPLRLRAYGRALQRFTAEAAWDFAARLGVASLEIDLDARALDGRSAEERIAFDRASSEDELRALIARSRGAPSAAVLGQLGSTARALVVSAQEAQRERWWSAVERGVERGLFEPASLLALAPKGRLRAFVERHADAVRELRVLAMSLRAMDPSEERAWLARTSIQRTPDAPADEATQFAIATALDDDRAADRWLRARHPNGAPRACLPPSLLVEAMNDAANRDEPSWWTDPPTPVLVAHARRFALGRSLLARCATAAIDAMFEADRDAVNKQRASLAELLRFADAQALDRAIALQERLGEWWLGHALIVRCKELQTSGALAVEALRAGAARLRRTLGFVPRGTLTMALIELAQGADRSLEELVREPPSIECGGSSPPKHVRFLWPMRCSAGARRSRRERPSSTPRDCGRWSATRPRTGLRRGSPPAIDRCGPPRRRAIPRSSRGSPSRPSSNRGLDSARGRACSRRWVIPRSFDGWAEPP
ncbi:MAG: hypothetical protein U0269_08985 [Polyangiales bacterium]